TPQLTCPGGWRAVNSRKTEGRRGRVQRLVRRLSPYTLFLDRLTRRNPAASFSRISSSQERLASAADANLRCRADPYPPHLQKRVMRVAPSTSMDQNHVAPPRRTTSSCRERDRDVSVNPRLRYS